MFRLRVRSDRFRPARLACAALLVLLALPRGASADADDALDEIVVTATRTPMLVRDAPIRVEAVPAEEIEENLTVRPGDVTSLLAELPGMQFQSNAPALGGASLQLRGVAGRHTLVLVDGLPLLGAETGSFGLLQVPPLDLARVEVVKGPMSALYGGAGLGGMLNLVSAPPGTESSFLLGANSRGARDALTFLATPKDSPLRATLVGGVHGQSRQDVDHDGWADLPEYRRFTVRPRAWFGRDDARSLYTTVGASVEERDGGTMPGRQLPSGAAFREALRTERYDAGATSTWTLADGRALNGRYSFTHTRSLRTFGAARATSVATTGVVEQTLAGTTGAHRWLAGAALEWSELVARATPGVSSSSLTPGAFAQDVWTPAPWMTIGANLRVDDHERFGTFASPRLSVLIRPAEELSVRLAAATGYSPPTPFVEAVDATWLGALLPLARLRAERARSASLDVRWVDDGLELNASAFVTEIRDALDTRAAAANRLELYNRAGRWRAPGVEVLAGYVAGPVHAIASWTMLDATLDDGNGARRRADRTPRQTATIAAILESERRGRIGIEAEYTGAQRVDDNPWRSRAPGYTLVNGLAEWRHGGFAVYVNALNLTGVRQTRRDPLIRPVPGPGGDPITTVWAPLEGRMFSVGVRGEL